MGRNDGGLLIIDSKTAQIKFAKNIDRDATFIVNRTITAEVLAIDGKKNTLFLGKRDSSWHFFMSNK